jgi:hypothetical protein
MWELEYANDYIMIVSNFEQETIIVIEIDQMRSKKIFIWVTGLDNEIVENAIREVLGYGYDIEEEIEKYRRSRMYKAIEEWSNN